MTRTQIERGWTSLYLSSNGTEEFTRGLLDARQISDARFAEISWFPTITLEYPKIITFESKNTFEDWWINDFRVSLLVN